MNLKRILTHLMMSERHVYKAFSRQHLDHIAQSIRASEMLHSGEIRVAVESALELKPLLQGQTPRQRAIEVFSDLHVWDTEHNNGVLVYVLLADHAIEILADRGIHARVDSDCWQTLCMQIQSAFVRGEFETGTQDCIEALSKLLTEHFPLAGGGRNELPDAPVVIG